MKPPISQSRRLLLGMFLVVVVPIPLAACSLCGTFSQDTMGEEMDRARLVVYGRAVASELFKHQGALPGSGRTEFHIDRVLKDHPLLTNKQGLMLGRYLPVPDRDNPPRLVVFCSANKDKLDAYLARGVQSEAVVAYLEGASLFRRQGRFQALQYYFQFLDNAEDVIACDAFQEFARASDAEVEQVRRFLKPEKLRVLLQNPRTKAEHLSLLAFLLGGCGNQRDADTMLTLIQRNDATSRKARDGLLAGYLSLKPREGWDLLRLHLADSERPLIPERYSAINAMRFSYNLKLGDYRQGAIRCLEVMLPDGESADFAVEDLRKWQIWDLTPLLLSQYDKESHATQIIRRAIIRYALSCPRPEAKQFLERIQQRDQEMIREVREGLEFEKLDPTKLDPTKR